MSVPCRICTRSINHANHAFDDEPALGPVCSVCYGGRGDQADAITRAAVLLGSLTNAGIDAAVRIAKDAQERRNKRDAGVAKRENTDG